MAFSNIFFLALMWLELCFIYYVGMYSCLSALHASEVPFSLSMHDPLPSTILHQILLPRFVYEIEERKILPVFFFFKFAAP